MADLPFEIFDADNHYYEAEDAFTRHLDPKMRRRCMEWAVVKGRKELLVPSSKRGKWQVINHHIRIHTIPLDQPLAIRAVNPIFRGRRNPAIRHEVR